VTPVGSFLCPRRPTAPVCSGGELAHHPSSTSPLAGVLAAAGDFRSPPRTVALRRAQPIG